jgi:hypothetical protein
VPLDLDIIIRYSKSGSVAQRMQNYKNSLAQDALTHPKTSIARTDYGANELSEQGRARRKLSAAAQARQQIGSQLELNLASCAMRVSGKRTSSIGARNAATVMPQRLPVKLLVRQGNKSCTKTFYLAAADTWAGTRQKAYCETLPQHGPCELKFVADESSRAPTRRQIQVPKDCNDDSMLVSYELITESGDGGLLHALFDSGGWQRQGDGAAVSESGRILPGNSTCWENCVSLTQVRENFAAGILAEMTLVIAVSTTTAENNSLQRHVEIKHATLVLTDLQKPDREGDDGASSRHHQKRRFSAARAP